MIDCNLVILRCRSGVFLKLVVRVLPRKKSKEPLGPLRYCPCCTTQQSLKINTATRALNNARHQTHTLNGVSYAALDRRHESLIDEG